MSTIIEISCRQVRRELSDYIEEDVTPELRDRIERHVRQCKDCRALFDGVNNALRLVSTGEVLQLPVGFSERLRQRIDSLSQLSPGC